MDILRDIITQDPLSALAYGLHMLAIVSLWLTRSWPTRLVLFGSTVALSLYCGRILPLGIVWIVLLAASTYSTYHHCPKRLWPFAAVALAVFAYLLTSHLMPGFHNWRVIDGHLLTPDAVPYTLYFNYDNACVGWVLAALWVMPDTGNNSISRIPKSWLLMTLLAVATLAIVGTLIGYIAWDPKFPAILLLWIPCNLIITCVTEEALFRGLLQRSLVRIVSMPFIGVVLASIAFGCAHYMGGPAYIALASVAGIYYGIAYLYARRIEASILTHFTLNLIHLLLFTYPALSST